jgi:uncharacterized membrane protein YebE (DUF533 family)
MFNTQNLLGAMLSSGFGGRNPRMAGFGGYPGGMRRRGGMMAGPGGFPAAGPMMGGMRPSSGMSGTQGAMLGVLGGLAVSALQRHLQQRATPAAPPSPDQALQPATPAAQPASPTAGATQADPAPTSAQAAAAPDQDRARLLVRAMIAAANADMSIDADERARILTKLEEAGTGPAERAFVEREMNAPMSIDDLAGEVSGPDVAAQVYAAALAAIDVDKATERRFLQALAERLGIDAEIVNEIHDQLGQPRPA